MKAASVLMFLVLSVFSLFAQPKEISYQGIIKDNLGATVTDGQYPMTFKIYDSFNSTVPIWDESLSVHLSGGIFNVILGSVNPINFGSNSELWLGISFNNTTEMSPRVKLTGSPYSLSTLKVDGAEISNSNINSSKIGQSSPEKAKFTEIAIGDNSINNFSTDATFSGNSDNSVPTEKAVKSYVDAAIAEINTSLTAIQTEVDYLETSLLRAAPIGSIMPYGGTSAPDGWKLCDGSALDRSGDYASLFSAIGTAFGAPNASQFNLPDLRGRFIRGVNGSQTWQNGDSTASSRIASMPGGNSGNNVGSFQMDETKRHSHDIKAYSSTAGGSSNNYVAVSPPVTPIKTATSQPAGSDETRPKNVYVNFIIKYKH